MALKDSSVDYTTDYAKKVVANKIVAGPHVRAACQRHITDLKTAGDRGYTFDVEKADRVFDFFNEILCLNGGDFEGMPYNPLPWQKFILGSIFGWVDEKGYRRFRVCFIETSKGSGKSPLAAGIGMYGLVADGESRAEIINSTLNKAIYVTC